MLSLHHTHGSALRSTDPPRKSSALSERSELEQKNKTPCRKTTEADVVPPSASGVFCAFVGSATQVLQFAASVSHRGVPHTWSVCTRTKKAPQIFGSIGTFGAGAKKQNALQENNGGRRGSAVCVRSFLCICGQCNTGAAVCRVCVPPRLSPYLERMYTYKKKALSCKRGGYRLLAILGEVYLTSSAALLDRADALQGYMRRVATVSV